ncbi:hypothetical protein J7L29_04630 [Candidatus Bathyarchaeota archaeon]|nr:hypothetical protein [Candidatus Bathyarchaeota archaeon]
MLSKPKIIVFILAFKKSPKVTLNSVLKQTIQPEKVVIVAAYEEACINGVECFIVPPNLELTVGERVGIALTKAFHKYEIEKYDYLVKLDDDAILDEKFLENNIKSGLEVIGRGAAMIIKTQCYLKYIGKKWPISSADDTFVVETLMAMGCKTMPFWWPHPAKLVKEPKGDLKRGWRIGIESYKLGLHPLRVFSSFLRALKRRETAALSIIPGYIYALLTRPKQYDLAKNVKCFNKFYVKMKMFEKIGYKKYAISWVITPRRVVIEY